MRFNSHSALEGKHAFLSASNYHWLNYDEDKLAFRFTTAVAAARGTELHNFAAEAIRLGIQLPETRKTINMYVNDAIGFRMEPEKVLCYSANCFGTADAISFRDNVLRIHDLKTGFSKTSYKQLAIYAALFCLEYNFRPFEIQMELRLYQNDDVEVFIADPDEIMHIMDKIIQFDKLIETLKSEAL